MTTPSYTATGVVSSPVGKGKIGQEVSERWKTGTTYFINAPLEQKVTKNLTISSVPYWTQSYSKYRDSADGNVAEVDGAISSITTTLTNIGTLNPGRTATYGPTGTGPAVDPQNLGGYTLTQVRLRPQTGYDTWSGAPVDVKYTFDTAIPLSLRVGYRYDDHVRQDSIFLNSLTSFTNPATSTGAAVSALQDNVFSGHDVGYGIGGFNWLSPYKAHQAFPNAVIPPLALSSDTYAIWNEYTSAPYLRLDTTLWDRFLIVAGVRYEKHVIHSHNRLPTGTAGLPGNASLIDERYYPSFNLKYNFTKNFDVRFGAAKSLGLPDYNQLIPSAPTITDPNASNPVGTISIFNPNIKAYTVYNYDLSFEYYFNPSGFLSASLYNKRFQNYLVTFTQGGTPALAAQYGVGATSQPISNYNITSTVNIPDSSGYYNGFELAYNQTLSFLPPPFNTTGLQINWSRLFIGGIRTHQILSNASPFQNAVLQQDAYLALYKTAITNEFNIALNTTYKRLNAFVTMNYTGAGLLSTTQATVAYTGQATNFYDLKAMTAPRA